MSMTVFFATIFLAYSTSSSPLSHTIEVTVGGVPLRLSFSEESDLEEVAAAFVEEHELRGGEGCDSMSCVSSMLATAMRQHVGECVGSVTAREHGSACITRTSVAGAVYRKQGAIEVERQLASEANSGRTWLLDLISLQRSREGQDASGVRERTRSIRAPCVPPHCYLDCATADAAQEARLAAEFIENDPELSFLMDSDPEPLRCQGGLIYPLFIGIPASEFVECVPRKYYGFQGGVRDHVSTDAASREYRFGPRDEVEYKRAYREAYFGVTKRKAGWDCLRHYEIMASGSIPFFVGSPGLDESPRATLAHWPKALLHRLTKISGIVEPGVSVNATQLDCGGIYAAAAAGLLAYGRARLTTGALADYVLRVSGHSGAKHVLLLSSHPDPDYMRDMLLHGLRKRLGAGLVDFIRPHHMYAPASGTDRRPHNFSRNAGLYGHGFTYAHRLRDDADHVVDRSRIEQRIRNHEFDVVVYASVHRGMPFWPAVLASYSAANLIFVDGEDEHGWSPWSTRLRSRGFYFMREIPDGCPPETAAVSHGEFDRTSFHGPFF